MSSISHQGNAIYDPVLNVHSLWCRVGHIVPGLKIVKSTRNIRFDPRQIPLAERQSSRLESLELASWNIVEDVRRGRCRIEAHHLTAGEILPSFLSDRVH